MSSSSDGRTAPSYKGIDRRTMLRSAGVAGGLVMASTVLAACGGKSSNGGTSSAKSAGGAIAKSKVPVGSGVIDNNLQSVITQPTSGEFKAFNYLCTHQGCPVSQISGSTIKCACHGSEFSIKDGSVVHGPATKPLTPKTATVKGSQVVVS